MMNVALTILGCSVNCRFCFGDCTLIHCYCTEHESAQVCKSPKQGELVQIHFARTFIYSDEGGSCLSP